MSIPASSPSAPNSLATEKSSSKSFPGKAVKILGVLILSIILVVGAIIFFKQKSSITSSSNPSVIPDVLLATVGNEKIYRSTVEAAAREQYTPQAINQTVLKRVYPTVIERAILDNEAQKLNIPVTDQEIRQFLTINHLPMSSYNYAKYSLLKSKIMGSQVKSVLAYVIGYWLPPVFRNEDPALAQQRAAGEKGLAIIQQKLLNGEAPLTVTQFIYNNFPSIQSKIAVNGNLYYHMKNPSTINPRLFTFNPADVNKVYFNVPLQKALITMQVNEVKIVMQDPSSGSGGDVIKVVRIQTNGFTSYNELLTAKLRELVKVIHTL